MERSGTTFLFVVVVFWILACNAAGSTAPLIDGARPVPDLVDVSSIQVHPRLARPDEVVSLVLHVHKDHAERVRKLSVKLKPSFIEPIDVSGSYDRSTGILKAVLPRSAAKFSGNWALHLVIEFECGDAKSCSQDQYLGNLEIHPYAGWTYEDDSFQSDLEKAQSTFSAALGTHIAAGRAVLGEALSDEAQRLIVLACSAHSAGLDSDAKAALEKADAVTTATADPDGVGAYRLLVSAWLKNHPPKIDPELTLMSVTGDVGPTDLSAIRWVGFNTILHNDSRALPKLKEFGFKTGASTPPVRMPGIDLPGREELHQERYLLSKPHKAAEPHLVIDLIAPYRKDQYTLDVKSPPSRYWRVYDRTTRKEIDPRAWRVDPNGHLTITNTAAGHTYQAAYLAFNSLLDPIHSEAENAILQATREFLEQRSPNLDIYRPTSLYYHFPSIRGNGKMSQWNWWGYQWGAGPLAQEKFETRTGTPFDPIWLIDDGRYGHINYPPRPEYLVWMRFFQKNVMALAERIVSLAHANGAKVRPFWGDHWIGMEPYLDFFEQTHADQIVKACDSAQCARMVTDIPADITKIIRFSPWLSWRELFRYSDPPGRILSRWQQIKRAALFQIPDGLSWGGRTLPSIRNDEIASAIKNVSDEFRLIHALVSGNRAFRHPGKIYLVNAWGKVRSWPAWGQINPSQDILVHLTDLPFDVEFLSLQTIAEAGIPGDALLLLNAGEPGSAWSGGFHWDIPKVVAKVTQFVENGGGLIGVDSPSFNSDPTPSWSLRYVFGLDHDGFTDGGAAAGSFTPNDQKRLNVLPAAWDGASKCENKSHWLLPTKPMVVAKQRANVRVKPIMNDVTLLCSGDGRTFAPPVITARQFGRGRTVYFNGFSTEPDYGDLLRRAIFWAGARESLYARLNASPAEVLVYLYPERQLLIVFNNAPTSRSATVKLDVKLLGLPTSSTYQLHDLLTAKSAAVITGVELADGFDISLGPGVVRFLNIRQSN